MLPSVMVLKLDNVGEESFATFGGFCDLFRGTYNGLPVALKRYRILKDTTREKKMVCGSHRIPCILRAVIDCTGQQFYQECLIWWNLSNPHIIPLLGITYDLFVNREVPCPVTPWMGNGNVRDFLSKHLQGPQFSKFEVLVHGWVSPQPQSQVHKSSMSAR